MNQGERRKMGLKVTKGRKKLALTTILLFMVFVTAFPMTASAAAKLSAKSKTVYVGSTYQLKVRGTKKKVKWSSNNKKVATVTSRGKVKAKKPGKAKITAKIGKKKLVCSVTVRAKGLNYKKKTICVGKTAQLKLCGIKGRAKWSSSNKSVATVNAKGKIKAKKTGTATITARVKSKKYRCKITVTLSKKEINKKACAKYRNMLGGDSIPWGDSSAEASVLSFICRDINNDGIKELVVQGHNGIVAGGNMRIYTYYSGKVKSFGHFTGHFQDGGLYACSVNKNFIVDVELHCGILSRTFYRLYSNGSRKVLAQYSVADTYPSNRRAGDQVVVKADSYDPIYRYNYGFVVNGKQTTYKNCMATISKLKKGAKYIKDPWRDNTASNRKKYIR